MEKFIFYLVTLLVLLNLSCKLEKKKPQSYISKINLSKDVSEFTSLMTENDTITIECILDMEWWSRRDKIILVKKKTELIINTSIKEDTTYSLNKKYRLTKMDEVRIDTSDNRFEQYFSERINRTIKNDEYRLLMYRIINQNDTISFYTKNLGDKGIEVEKYSIFMKRIFPNNKNFILLEEIIEIVEDGIK